MGSIWNPILSTPLPPNKKLNKNENLIPNKICLKKYLVHY